MDETGREDAVMIFDIEHIIEQKARNETVTICFFLLPKRFLIAKVYIHHYSHLVPRIIIWR